MTVFILPDLNSGLCLDDPYKLYHTFSNNPGQCFAHILKHENFLYEKWLRSSVNQSSGMTGVEGKRIIITSTEWPYLCLLYHVTCHGTLCTKHGVRKVGTGSANSPLNCTKMYLTTEVQNSPKILEQS